MKLKVLAISLFQLLSLNIIAETNNEDLNFYKEIGIISQDEYDILNSGSKLLNGKYLYELRVNGNIESKTYEILVEDGKMYFPIFKFFEIIEFKNYYKEGQDINCFLGEDMQELTIDTNEMGFWKEKEFYVLEDNFKEYFLRSIRIDDSNFRLNMFLKFSSPRDIKNIVARTKDKLEENKDKKDIIYTNKPTLFELGYLRVKLDKIYSKDKSYGSGKFKDTWDGKLEYQGAFLYGQFLTSYNLKEHELEDNKLLYNDIWEQHTLEIGNYSTGSSSREWGISFKKDKGYLITRDKTYIIKENVPIGSRVELLYMGIPIAVEDAINGTVYFKNDEIKGDRQYILKIHTPDGKIYMKKIDTASDYNQQNKGQIEYNIDFREVAQSGGKIRGTSRIYYGLTENTTIGLDYNRDVESIDKSYKYMDTGKIELIHSNYIFSYPYTFVIGKEKSFTSLYDKGKFQAKGQIDIEKFRIKVNREKKDKYYRDKLKYEYSLEYRPINNLLLKYEIESSKFYDKTKEKNKKYSGSYSKSYKNFLVSGEYEHSTLDKDKYMLNFYYSGFRSFTVKLENQWRDSGKEYETAFTIFNNTNGKFDYSIELRHSQRDKSMVTFKFNLQYDNWFNFDMLADKKGNQQYKIGLDRIIDLKNPKTIIENIDSTRVKVITFVDANNNNIYDKDEKKLGNVKVKIGKNEIITDENGEGVFYGIPNHMIYDLDVVIRKPSFVLGKNKIKIKGRNTSTLEAYIPVKPMLTLTGKINLNSDENKPYEQKINMYRNVLAKLKNNEGKILEMSVGDEEGIFQMSGLLPGKYIVELEYIGNDYHMNPVTQEIELDYKEKQTDVNLSFGINLEELK